MRSDARSSSLARCAASAAASACESAAESLLPTASSQAETIESSQASTEESLLFVEAVAGGVGVAIGASRGLRARDVVADVVVVVADVVCVGVGVGAGDTGVGVVVDVNGAAIETARAAVPRVGSAVSFADTDAAINTSRRDEQKRKSPMLEAPQELDNCPLSARR